MTSLREGNAKKIIEDITKTNPRILTDAFVDFERREDFRKLISDRYTKYFTGTEEELERQISDFVTDNVGLGIVEKLLEADPDITDITFNGTHLIAKSNTKRYLYSERLAKELDIEYEKVDEIYIERFCRKIANAQGEKFNTQNPILDCVMMNLRLNAVHNIVARQGTTMALRVTRPIMRLDKDNFSDFAPIYMYDFFRALVEARSNIIIAGATGTGKTEFQKLLVGFIKESDKVCLMEDVLEFHAKKLFPNKDIHSWLAANDASFSDLIKASLRNNPDWITISEVRGAEAFNMLQAAISDHSIITTIHAKSAKVIPRRIVSVIKNDDKPIDEASFLEDFYDNIQIGVHLKAQVINGKTIRYLSEVVEYLPGEKLNVLFSRKPNENGEFELCLGESSEELLERLIEHGVKRERGELRKNAENKKNEDTDI